MKKLDDLTTSDEDLSNDVIDVSKECGKDTMDNRESLNLIYGTQRQTNMKINAESIYTNEQYQQSLNLCSTPERVKKESHDLNQKALIEQYNSLLSGKMRNASPGLIENQLSTFQASPNSIMNKACRNLSPTFMTNERFNMTLNLDGTKLLNNPSHFNQNFHSDLNYSSSNTMTKDIQKELLIKIKNQIEENNLITRCSKEDNPSGCHSPKVGVEHFTSKLPPVPRRNSKSSLSYHTSNKLSQARNPSPLNANLKYAGPNHLNSTSPQPRNMQISITNSSFNCGEPASNDTVYISSSSPQQLKLSKKGQNFYQKI